jgi:outer membrane protein OmpA-like peptidoglycan-associated protein
VETTLDVFPDTVSALLRNIACKDHAEVNVMKSAFLLFTAGGLLLAQQVPNPTQNRALSPTETGQPAPIFRVTVVSRTTKAINYHHRTGSTKIDFRGTELLPPARGDAKVESQMGSTKIDVHFDHLSAANQFGPEYLTYVMWAITPEGRPANLGEVVVQGDKAHLLATTDLQAFGLIVTAEPYFAVTQPSDVVVMENFIRTDTTGTIQQVDAKFELLQRGQYVLNRAAYRPVKINPKGPLQLAEAENAVEIARLAGADKYAADTFQKALIDLQNAEAMMSSKSNSKQLETNAREAAQMAEDARIITIRKIQAEIRAREQADAEAARVSAENSRVAAERAEAARQAEAQRAADSARQAEDAARQAREAQMLAEKARREQAEAEQARARALADQQQAQAEADRARLAAREANEQRQVAENEKVELRRRLEQQLNMILETHQTARGLIVNINDVLFDFNKYTLKPGAREKLAKVSGILLAYPSLRLQLEGHTDSIGSDEYNLTLSQKRAESVRDYIVEQGVASANVSAVGLGKDNPVATNDTNAGRQQNRRVEMVVSGDVIGIPTSQITTPQR